MPYTAVMADVLFLVITVAFFAGAAGFVTLCDRIIGADPDLGMPPASADPDVGSVATTDVPSAAAPRRAARAGGDHR